MSSWPWRDSNRNLQIHLDSHVRSVYGAIKAVCKNQPPPVKVLINIYLWHWAGAVTSARETWVEWKPRIYSSAYGTCGVCFVTLMRVHSCTYGFCFWCMNSVECVKRARVSPVQPLSGGFMVWWKYFRCVRAALPQGFSVSDTISLGNRRDPSLETHLAVSDYE